MESTAEARPARARKKRKEAASSEGGVHLTGRLFAMIESTVEGRPAGAGKKRKEAGASEGGGTWRRKRNKAMVHLVGLFTKKMKEAVASESGDNGALEKEKEGDNSLFKEGEMLKLREELWEAERLWSEKLVPGALDRWLERKKTTLSPARRRRRWSG
jgi:hypothetical protein